MTHESPDELLPFEAAGPPLPIPALAAAGALLAASYPFADWCAWQSWDTSEAWLVAWPIATALLVVGLVALAALRYVRAETRASARSLLLLAVLLAAASVFALRAAELVSAHETHRFVERSEPLVAALERCERQRGAVPARLEDLVPAFLSRVPATGIGICPAYRLEKGPSTWQLVLARVPGATGEELLHAGRGEPVHGPEDRKVGTWWVLHLSE